MTFPLKIQLDWLPNAQFAGILYAHYHGRYTQAGIDLTILPWEACTNPMDSLEKEENFVVSTENNLLVGARAQGKPVKAIGTMMQYSGIGWMSLVTSGVQTLPDLKGKRLGIHGDGELAINTALDYHGMTQEDLEILEVGYDYVELLTSGELDAMQCFIMVEPLEMEQQGHSVNIIRGYDLGYQVYAQVIATTENLITEQFEMLVQFLKVTYDGWRAAFMNPDEISQIIVTNYLKEGEADLQKRMLLAMQPLIAGDVGLEKLGWMESERWQNSIVFMRASGMIDVDMAPNQMMTNRLLKQLY